MGGLENAIYLGPPQMIGRAKITAFSEIKQSVWKELQGWKEKFLSHCGNDVLIKAVAMSIPTYMMNCFKLPLTLCDELEKLMTRFWWGQHQEETKIHWVS